MIKIAPSILSADFSRLGEDVRKAEAAGADMIHLDVMDGHFVPNITMGPLVVKAVRKMTRLPLDVHLMIEYPDKFIEAFADSGSDIISFHAEASGDPFRTISLIKKNGCIPALAVNPDFSPKKIGKYLPKVNMVLAMTVFPGFEGQKFIPSVLPKIRALKSMINDAGLKVDIEVDGGINRETASKVLAAGANILVAGSAVFYSKNYKKTIDILRNA